MAERKRSTPTSVRDPRKRHYQLIAFIVRDLWPQFYYSDTPDVERQLPSVFFSHPV